MYNAFCQMKSLLFIISVACMANFNAIADDDDRGRGRGRDRYDDDCEIASPIPEAGTYGAVGACVFVGGFAYLRSRKKS